MDTLEQAVEEARQRGAPPPGYRDPTTGTPSIYAARVGARNVADSFFLDSFFRVGGATAAELTCRNFGHEPRGGTCQRCGAPT